MDDFKSSIRRILAKPGTWTQAVDDSSPTLAELMGRSLEASIEASDRAASGDPRRGHDVASQDAGAAEIDALRGGARVREARRVDLREAEVRVPEASAPWPARGPQRLLPAQERPADATSAQEARVRLQGLVGDGQRMPRPAEARSARSTPPEPAAPPPHRSSRAPGAGLTSGGRTVEDLVRDAVRPMLREWLEANLGGIVERQVRQEIDRLARGR